MPCRIDLLEVGHSYGAASVFDSVSFSIPPGKAIALTGPSGSGKTTLLSIIGGVLRPSRGRIRVQSDHSERSELKTAWVFQTMNALGSRSVVDNVAMGALSDGASRADSLTSAMEMIGRMGLAHRASHRASALSGGELQRMCVARALAARPDLLLADEPTGNLDPENAVAVASALIQQRPRGTTVVVATHDALVAAECDRTVALDSPELHET